MKYFRFPTFIFLLLLLTFCKKDNSDTVIFDGVTPIVMVHGYLGSGDSYEWMAKRFTSNGFPQEKIFVFDWNTFSNDARNIQPLVKFIKTVLKETGAKQVNLIGHSMGGGLSYNYCKDPENAKNILNLAMVAPFLSERETVPSPLVTTLNIWTKTDYVVFDSDSIDGAINLELDDIDHNEIIACPATFTAIYKLFTGNLPATTNIIEEDNPIISGKVVSFIENFVGKGTKVDVYEINSGNGFRISETPNFSFVADENGRWGPMNAKKGTYYEFNISSNKPGDRSFHFYREPFLRSDKLVYLRSFPPKSSLLNSALSSVPANDEQAVSVFFSASKAVWTSRDVLKVNETELSTPQFCAPELNSLAFFLYDANRNMQTDLTSIPLFEVLLSLKGVDFFFPTVQPRQSVRFDFNGRILNTPNWPSKEDGISVAVFD